MPARATYRLAGVSLARADRLVTRIRELAERSRRPEVVADIGGFAALFRTPRRYCRPLLVAAADGVGTKLRVAMRLRRHRTVGIDLVAMNVNDILTVGAEPLVFLDYFATGRLRPAVAQQVLEGIAQGCTAAGCALVGGETAEMPSFYAGGEYDLAGFAVGVVEEREVVDGRRIRPGDILIGLASNGLHSNGFSLVRHLVFETRRLRAGARVPGSRTALAAELLRPTRIYVRPVLEVLRRGHRVNGMAHVTGGGLPGNVPRVLPEGCEAVIFRESWPVPPIFSFLQALGNVAPAEMYRTFNMGIGYVLVVPPAEVRPVLARLAALGEQAYVIGEIRHGARSVRLLRGAPDGLRMARVGAPQENRR